MKQNEAMRVALVGCGMISANHLSALAETPAVTVVALCDIRRDRAGKRAAEFCRNAVIYTDYTEMLETEKPDAVHICTPHWLHADMAVAALIRNIHVFLEKPACISEEEAARLLAAERASSARITVCFQNRKNPAMEKMLEQIRHYGGREAITGGRAMVSWCRDAAYYADDWHGKKKTEGGGVLINQAIHTLDLLLYYCGTPVAVQGSVHNRHLSGVTEVEDAADFRIRFRGGAVGCFSATTAYVTDAPNFIEVLVGGHKLVLYGEILLSDGNVVPLPKTGDVCIGKACYGGGHRYMIRDFYRAVREGAAMPVSLLSAVTTTRTLLAVYRSDEKEIYL